ncbi:MAG: branched-chain amino acid ABC transporter permease [Thermodesulfobacteriota bacterium]
MLNQVLQLALSGVAIGSVYGLIALGFVLVYKATEIINFSQGELMMLGAFAGFTFVSLLGLPYWVSFILSIAFMFLIGVLLDLIVLRRILGHSAFSIIMVTIGFGYFMRGIVSMIPAWGTDTYNLPTPFSGSVLRFGGLALSGEYLSVIVMTIIICVILFCFFKWSRVGVAMQASSQNQLAAYYMGIPVRRVNTLTWGICAAAATFAGILLAPITFVHSNMGFVGLKAFPAAVLGGFGSLPGAIAGGIIIGLIESFSGFYLPEGIKDISAYVVLLIVLVIKPNGLFGERLTKKV